MTPGYFGIAGDDKRLTYAASVVGMDEALRKRLDAIVALLAVVVFLLVGVVVAVGGLRLLSLLVLVGVVVGFFAWSELATDGGSGPRR